MYGQTLTNSNQSDSRDSDVSIFILNYEINNDKIQIVDFHKSAIKIRNGN